jgi:hypothetical protein
MPCHVPATSVSSRRRSLYPKRPPTIAAKLDLSKPGEAWAEDYLRRASTGKEAFWRPLAIRRDDAALLVAVQWLDGEPAKRSVLRCHALAHRASFVMAQVPQRQSSKEGACSPRPCQAQRTLPPLSRAVTLAELPTALAKLRIESSRDVWIVGGGQTARECLSSGLVDELELYVIPTLLGAGIPLLSLGTAHIPLRLLETHSFPNGITKLRYEVQ